MTVQPAGSPILWTPSAARRERAAMTGLMAKLGCEDCQALWRWSVDDVPRFWPMLGALFEIEADGDPTTVLADDAMPAVEPDGIEPSTSCLQRASGADRLWVECRDRP